MVQVEFSGAAQCATNAVDILVSVNKYHDSRSQYDAHMRSLTSEDQGKQNSDQTENRESKTPTRWKILVLHRQSVAVGRRAHQDKLKDRGPPTPCGSMRSRTMPGNNGASERSERTPSNHIEFCATEMFICSCPSQLQHLHVQPKRLSRPTYTYSGNLTNALLPRINTKPSRGSRCRRCLGPMSN